MANSNWVEADKQCQRKRLSRQEAFRNYILWFIATGEEYICDGSWRIYRVYENLHDTPLTVELQFFTPAGYGSPAAYRWPIRSLEDWERALTLNHCPVPQSLTTILGEFRQGRDGKAAVNFYTQTGDTF